MLKLTVHTKGLEEIKDKLMQASSKAEHTLAIQIRKDTSPYVPALTGSLDTRTRIEGFSNAGSALGQEDRRSSTPALMPATSITEKLWWMRLQERGRCALWAKMERK